MAKKEFEGSYAMKREVFNMYHIYFIDSLQTEFGNVKLTSLYVADKTVKLDKYTKISVYSDDYLIVEVDYGDGVPRLFKGFKTKEAAQAELYRLRGY